MRYVAPAIESRTPVKALMTTPISSGQISPRWKRTKADEREVDDRQSHD